MNRLQPSRFARSSTIKCMLSLCIAGTGLFAFPPLPGSNGWAYPAAHAAAPVTEAIAPQALRSFAADAISKLAVQAPFSSWADADVTVEPLGPGTKSWLVTLYNASGTSALSSPHAQQLGYLIISATPQGDYKLVEYGTGQDAPYSSQALHTGTGNSHGSSRSITRVYGGPLLTAWKVVTKSTAGPTAASAVHYLDAISGESLPETEPTWNTQAEKYTPPPNAYGSDNASLLSPGEVTTTGEPFDPYENIMWMAAGPEGMTALEVISTLDAKKRIVFVTSGSGRTYRFPLPVYGYQTWAEPPHQPATDTDSAPAVYLLTDSNGVNSRWISLDALVDGGIFIVYAEDNANG